jgi:uncharacterized membrane protein YfcA
MFSSFISGLSGFGFSMVALSLLSLFINMKSAVVFLAIHTLTCNIFQLIRLRKHISIKKTIFLLAGSLCGVPAGVYLLKSVDPWWIKKALGLVIIYFVAQQILYSKKNGRTACPRQNAPGEGEGGAALYNKKKALAGFLAGVTGGALMGGLLSGGPPVIIYAMKVSKNNKYFIKATLQSFFLFSGLYSIVFYFAYGMLTTPILLSSMVYLPVTLAGTALGILAFERISFAFFQKVLLVLMAALGLSMLIR